MGDPDREYRRILVVGCSRSGTTLLQSLLASHSRIHTFPETGVFLKTFGMRGIVLPWVRLGLTLGKERKALARLLATQKGASGALPPLPPRRLLLSRSLMDVVAFLDGLAAAHGKDIWVEKTPRHVYHARRIGRSIPGCLCIHMIRKGEDVVASIVDRARRFPDRFPRQSDPSYAIRQWNRSLRATEAALADPAHVVVTYERLVTELEGTLRDLSRVMGLPFELEMLRPADPAAFTTREEEWKDSVNGPVVKAASKFEALFDSRTRREISGRLDSDLYERLLLRGLPESDAGSDG